MSELAKTFSTLKSRDEGALIAYIAAGDPDPNATPAIVEALVQGGADIIELGIPFSDPIADGPTIQAASLRALKAGTNPKKVLQIAETLKEKIKQPIVIMTYFNPIYKMGLRAFFESANASGICGVIVPDLPIEEAEEHKKLAEIYNIDTIFFITPSSSPKRIKKTLEFTSGFLYLVSVFGVTGARSNIQQVTIKLIKRALSITEGTIPLAVGFGISKPEHVQTILKNGADAVIVGSAFVKIIEDCYIYNNGNETLQALEKYSRKLKNATIKIDLESKKTYSILDKTEIRE